jgi:transposase
MDNRVKHEIKTRIEAARLFDAGFGYSQVGTFLILPSGTMRNWQDLHRQGRLIGLVSMGVNKNYSAKVKLAAVEKFLAGTSKADVMDEFGISTRAVFNKWVAAYRLLGAQGLASKPRGRPKRDLSGKPETDAEKIFRLEMEVAVLKKYNALVAAEEVLLLAKQKSSRH